MPKERRSVILRPAKAPTVPGALHLQASRLVVALETGWPVWRRVVLLGAGFLLTALFGIPALLPVWMHSLGLTVFTVFLIDAIGRAKAAARPRSRDAAARRLEEASHLVHRPYDVITGKPLPQPLDAAQTHLWQVHQAQALQQASRLRWPLPWSKVPRTRQTWVSATMAVALVVLTVYGSWGEAGQRLGRAINPPWDRGPTALSRQTDSLDLWVTPPAYTGVPPLVLSSRGQKTPLTEPLRVPEGSDIMARLTGGKFTPVLYVNGEAHDFKTTEANAVYEYAGNLKSGESLSVWQGWIRQGQWDITVVADQPPSVKFALPPEVTARKTVRLDIDVADDYGVTKLVAHINPTSSQAGVKAEETLVELTPPPVRNKETRFNTYQDLTAHRWAGLPVSVFLEAFDQAGHSAKSESLIFTLPERVFTHPSARALIDARKNLMADPANARVPSANLMASIAFKPANYSHDPVVALALRASAVRLVLNHDPETLGAVIDALWRIALRIEDGAAAMAEETLRTAQKELADALDRNASPGEIAALSERLQEAMAHYMAALADRARRTPQDPALEELMDGQTQILDARDLMAMAQKIGDLAATGSREAAQQMLNQLQRLMENLQGSPHALTAEQEAALTDLKDLRQTLDAQKKLREETSRAARQKENSSPASAMNALEKKQSALREQLGQLLGQIGTRGAKIPESMAQADQAMQEASRSLASHKADDATVQQGKAVEAMQQAMNELREDLQAQMMMPGGRKNGESQGARDPLGRPQPQGQASDDGTVKIPDHAATQRAREILDEIRRRAGDGLRPRLERDYIERLLERF